MKPKSFLFTALRAFPAVVTYCLVLTSVLCQADEVRGVAVAGTPSLGGQSATPNLSSKSPSSSVQSVIIESDGYACMGDDKSRKQTETASFQDAKRHAAESATTYIKSETSVKDGMLEKDLISAYAHAQVRVVQELLKEWYKEAGLGDCYRVRINAEVAPDERAMASISAKGREALEGDPSAPLNVRVWTNRPTYTEGECARLYLKGNKPFYGRIVYKQADGTLLQLLPNPFRQSNHFEGGTVYELPSAEDQFAMESCAPFGTERITLYASTAPGGDPEVEAADKVYLVKTKAADMSLATRGLRLTPKSGSKRPMVAEFAEASAEMQTSGK